MSEMQLTFENGPSVHNCPKNYTGSSKRMEATSALDMVKAVFEHKTVCAFVTEVVIDDDASTPALLLHSLCKLAWRVIDVQWPLDTNGRRVPKGKDMGKLPFYHLIIKFVADLMHQIRTFGKYIFGMANAPMSTSTCTMVDAYHLKCNFGYWLLELLQ